MVLLAGGIPALCVGLRMSFYDFAGQRGRLCEAVFDAGHKCSSHQWNTHAWSPGWSRIS